MELAGQKNKWVVLVVFRKVLSFVLYLIAFLVAILCLILLLGCSGHDDGTESSPALNNSVVKGSVKDEDGNPYPNTTITLSKSTTHIKQTTDTEGNFNFSKLAAHMYDVEVTVPLSTELTANTPTTIDVKVDQTTTIDFVVQTQMVKANLNFGDAQLLEEIKDKDGNTPTAENEPLYAANIFDAPIGFLTAIKAPDGHHLTLGEYKMAKGNLKVHCNGATSTIEIALEGMIPNGTYTFWLAYLNKTKKLGDTIDFMNDFVNFNNPPLGAPSGTENILVSGVDGTISATLQHSSCVLTDEVALVIPILYHINGKTFGGGHVPDVEEVVQMLVYFQ